MSSTHAFPPNFPLPQGLYDPRHEKDACGVAMVATLTFLPFILNSSITTLTSLDFLGFGLPPGSPSLGELLLQGKSNLQAPWLGLTGFVATAFMLSLLIFAGEAVRDAFDPKSGR